MIEYSLQGKGCEKCMKKKLEKLAVILKEERLKDLAMFEPLEILQYATLLSG